MSRRHIHHFWYRVNEAILDTGKSKIEIAKLIGCNRKTLIAQGDDSRTMDAFYIARLCAVTGVSADWLLGLRKEKKMKEMEKIDHPAHYNLNGRKECIEEMLELYGPEKVAAFCELNAYKYRYRHEWKGGAVDLEKARWYEHYMEMLKRREDDLK